MCYFRPKLMHIQFIWIHQVRGLHYHSRLWIKVFSKLTWLMIKSIAVHSVSQACSTSTHIVSEARLRWAWAVLLIIISRVMEAFDVSECPNSWRLYFRWLLVFLSSMKQAHTTTVISHLLSMQLRSELLTESFPWCPLQPTPREHRAPSPLLYRGPN